MLTDKQLTILSSMVAESESSSAAGSILEESPTKKIHLGLLTLFYHKRGARQSKYIKKQSHKHCQLASKLIMRGQKFQL